MIAIATQAARADERSKRNHERIIRIEDTQEGFVKKNDAKHSVQTLENQVKVIRKILIAIGVATLYVFAPEWLRVVVDKIIKIV